MREETWSRKRKFLSVREKACWQGEDFKKPCRLYEKERRPYNNTAGDFFASETLRQRISDAATELRKLDEKDEKRR